MAMSKREIGFLLIYIGAFGFGFGTATVIYGLMGYLP